MWEKKVHSDTCGLWPPLGIAFHQPLQSAVPEALLATNLCDCGISETSLRDISGTQPGLNHRSGEEGRTKSFLFWNDTELLGLLCQAEGQDYGSDF